METKMKKVFAGLVLYRHNIHTLHWKTCGTNFDCIHALMETYVDKFGEFIDQIGEIMLIHGYNPLSLSECLEIATNDTESEYLVLAPTENYCPDKCFEFIGIMFDGLYKLYSELYADENLGKEICSVLDGHMYWLKLENKYKNIRRVIK